MSKKVFCVFCVVERPDAPAVCELDDPNNTFLSSAITKSTACSSVRPVSLAVVPEKSVVTSMRSSVRSVYVKLPIPEIYTVTVSSKSSVSKTSTVIPATLAENVSAITGPAATDMDKTNIAKAAKNAAHRLP